MKSSYISKVVIAALLCAIGIIIPMYSPFKIILEPASFTLGSHIAIFIAMFISPFVAASVALGTTIGFFLGGFPVVVILRAGSHLLFAMLGAFILKKHSEIITNYYKTAIFAVLISIIHAIAEVVVVVPFYFGSSMTEAYYAKGFVTSIILLVGVGTVVHSVVDFILAFIIWRALRANKMMSI